MEVKNTGDNINAKNASWSFSGEVPKQFEDHVSKSVPLYNEGHDLILKVSDFFLSEDSICYDIGCSTGLLLDKLAERHDKEIQFIGLDIEPDMISFAKEFHQNKPNISLEESNILEFDFQKSDLIIAYYTIQFIKPRVRQLIFDKIYESLNWGGALMLFEKVRSPDARFQDVSTLLYTDFKIDNGYSAENIIAKSKSLKGVLEPFSTQGNLDLMQRAGFVDIMSIMKYVCFEGFLAIK